MNIERKKHVSALEQNYSRLINHLSFNPFIYISIKKTTPKHLEYFAVDEDNSMQMLANGVPALRWGLGLEAYTECVC